MKTSNNTILITGGTAGIGLALAKELMKDNTVIITGRDSERLRNTLEASPGLIGIQGDVTNLKDIDRLVNKLRNELPTLNMVINNAGTAIFNHILTDDDISETALSELDTNYLSVMRLTQRLMPVISIHPEAAIVNVSSIVAYAPSATLATYSASKAALHSYTQALRFILRDTGIRVFELLPPLVATEFSAEIGGLENGIPPSQVAEEFIRGVASDNYEIRVAGTEQFYRAFLASPADAVARLNQVL